jgi:hypothetical protein
MLLRAHRIDRMIKGVEPGDPWDAIVDLSMDLAGKPVIAVGGAPSSAMTAPA